MHPPLIVAYTAVYYGLGSAPSSVDDTQVETFWGVLIVLDRSSPVLKVSLPCGLYFAYGKLDAGFFAMGEKRVAIRWSTRNHTALLWMFSGGDSLLFRAHLSVLKSSCFYEGGRNDLFALSKLWVGTRIRR
jgi:hypothetical protein